ncbi:MAG TPA: hypothetical protein VH539_20395 [Gemmatimonadaceae bacterium]|jgi:hypothetical protein
MAAAIRAPQLLSLEPVLRCPNRRCLRRADEIDADVLTMRCRQCSAEWWATRLRPGNIRAQLLEDFGDESFVDYLIGMYELPESIDRPMYWQVWTRRDGQVAIANAMPATSIRDRARIFFHQLVSGHRQA